MSNVADIVELQEERSKRVPITDNEFANAGAMLKAAREALGYSIQDVHEATNVREDYLEHIERMEIDALPIAAYTSGFVKAYAQYLELPADAMVARFRKEAGYGAAQTVAPELEVRPRYELSGGRELSLLAVAAILCFVIWVAYQITRPAEDTGPVQIQGTPLQERPIEEPEISYTSGNEIPGQTTPGETVPATEPAANLATQTATAPPAETDLGPATQPQESEGTERVLTEDLAAETETATEDSSTLLETESETPTLTSAEALQLELQDPLETDVLELETVELDPAPIAEPVLPSSSDPVFTDPIRITMVPPIYPARCQRRAADVERVVVAFDVNTQGQPVNQRIAETSNDCLNSASLNAVDRWLFNPATRNGEPVPAYSQSAEFVFRIPE